MTTTAQRSNRITNTTPTTRPAKATDEHDPIAHLTPEDIEAIGRELDAIRDEVMNSRGARDAQYIRGMIKAQRWVEMTSRFVLLFSRFPPAFVVGTAGLTLAKIIENTEIGHNVLHGQWDWMRDEKIHSSTWEWDFASPAEQWKKSHNVEHHTYTNVIGMDNDLGYNILRVDPDQEWKLNHLFQPLTNFLTALVFEYGIAAYDLDVKGWKDGTKDPEVFRAELKVALKKMSKQMLKDYVAHPLLSGPSAVSTLVANLIANTLRNVWAHSVILCGHLPEGVETFETDSIDGETRGEWYVRQMLGSANITGSRFMHVMTGNLSHQIEHHLFPDMPSNRYAQIAPRIRELMERHDLRYVSGSLPRQVFSAWRKVFRYSLPNKRDDVSRWRQITTAARDAVDTAVRSTRGILRPRPRRRALAGATA